MAELVIALLVTSIHAIHATGAEKATLFHLALHPKVLGFLSRKYLRKEKFASRFLVSLILKGRQL